jgi:hypothetical protein
MKCVHLNQTFTFRNHRMQREECECSKYKNVFNYRKGLLRNQSFGDLSPTLRNKHTPYKNKSTATSVGRTLTSSLRSQIAHDTTVYSEL